MDKDTDNVLGSSVKITLVGFNNNEQLTGKVDTGASICSLDAQNIKKASEKVADGQSVTFSHGGKQYKMVLATHQAVQSADGGTEYRPVVKFDVKINDKVYNDILFNLNDRSEMPDKVLLGKNLIEKGKFVVDITQNTNENEQSNDIEFVAPATVVDPQPVSVVQSPTQDKTTAVETVFNALKAHPEITIGDMLEYMKNANNA